MGSWISGLFAPKPEPLPWQQAWDARRVALEALFGPADDQIVTSPVPIYMGGNCDVLTFSQNRDGIVYCTAGLTGTSAQKPSSIGNYELMMMVRQPVELVPGLISSLANYTLSHRIEPFQTIDLGEEQPPEVTTRALLALHPQSARGSFTMLGRQFGLLLLVGITASELVAYRGAYKQDVLAQLRKTVLPHTDLTRQSVI